MNERKVYQYMTWKRLSDGSEFKKRYSFKTAENAIKDAIKWRDKLAKDLNRAVVKVEVVDKETGEKIWGWEA